MNFGTFKFITFKNCNKYISIHSVGCAHAAQHGGKPKDSRQEYSGFMSLASAEKFAEASGLEIKKCTNCNPTEE
jgi:hypothetical protein